MKKTILFLAMILSIGIYAQNISYYGGNNGCFTINGNTFTSSHTAQCSNCYNWQVSPSTGLAIVGSNQTQTITVNPTTAGIYTVTLSYFDNQGNCNECTQQVEIAGGGPCGCNGGCESVCFSNGRIGFSNPDVYGQNYMVGVKTEISGSSQCNNCIKEIEYTISGAATPYDWGFNPNNTIYTDLGNHSYKLLITRAYIIQRQSSNLPTFSVFWRPTDWNQQITARIHFTNGHISDRIMIYTIHLLGGQPNSLGVVPHEILPRDRNICWIAGVGVEPWQKVSHFKENEKLKKELKKVVNTNQEESVVFPNPTNDLVNVDLKDSKNATISVLSKEGNLIKTFTIKKQKVFQFSAKELNLKKGIYFIQIEKKDKTEVKQLLIK